MKFVWTKDRGIPNEKNIFVVDTNGEGESLTVCAVDFYQVFADGEFIAFGPQRTAAGFTRPNTIRLNGQKKIEVSVISYNISAFSCDKQLPFFGAEIKKGDTVLYSTEDFCCERDISRIREMPRIHRQRGFVEGWDFTRKGRKAIEVAEVSAPEFVAPLKDVCDYHTENMRLIKRGVFEGFSAVGRAYWKNWPRCYGVAGAPDFDEFFAEKTKGECFDIDYQFERIKTGFIRLELDAKEETELFVIFDDCLPNGKWEFRRNWSNNATYLKIPAGKTQYLAEEPQGFMYLKIISQKEIDAQVSIKTLENEELDFVTIEGDERLAKVFNAAKNTFAQTAIDGFMDCPTRERGCWLADGTFQANAELLMTGKDDIERAFLENFLIYNDFTEYDPRMVPKLFPADQTDEDPIVNWAMFFILQIASHAKRSGKTDFAALARKKVYEVIECIEDTYVNELGLVSDDTGKTIFVDWSYPRDFRLGINFPTNMLYAVALRETGKLYGDKKLLSRAEELTEKIVALSWNGEFFVDNAIREEGKWVVCEENVSEACQAYALCLGFCPDEEYKERILTEFGTLGLSHKGADGFNATEVEKRDGRKCEGRYGHIPNCEISHGLLFRFFWLAEIEEYDQLLDEIIALTLPMAERTGTLWEHDYEKDSLCHGLGACVSALIARALTGYVGVVEGKPVFKDGKRATKYKATLKFKT